MTNIRVRPTKKKHTHTRRVLSISHTDTYGIHQAFATYRLNNTINNNKRTNFDHHHYMNTSGPHRNIETYAKGLTQKKYKIENEKRRRRMFLNINKNFDELEYILLFKQRTSDDKTATSVYVFRRFHCKRFNLNSGSFSLKVWTNRKFQDKVVHKSQRSIFRRTFVFETSEAVLALCSPSERLRYFHFLPVHSSPPPPSLKKQNWFKSKSFCTCWAKPMRSALDRWKWNRRLIYCYIWNIILNNNMTQCHRKASVTWHLCVEHNGK